METVTEQISNPFGMRMPCDRAVYGYGDANADFHVVGDHPGVHGGARTGVPFTDSLAGSRIQRVLAETGFLDRPYDTEPAVENCILSYSFGCVAAPTSERYDELERFVDAELRAVNAHVLLPVGDRATRYVLATHTTREAKRPDSAADLHATEIRGRGFLVVPVAEPAGWAAAEADALVDRLRALLASDYRQTKGVATNVG